MKNKKISLAQKRKSIIFWSELDNDPIMTPLLARIDEIAAEIGIDTKDYLKDILTIGAAVLTHNKEDITTART